MYGWHEYKELWQSSGNGSGSGSGNGNGNGSMGNGAQQEQGQGQEQHAAESLRGSLQQTAKRLGRPLAADRYPHLAGQPVYISLTTIHNRLYGIAATIDSILQGAVLPSHIYIFLSEGKRVGS
jgi:hypothetical protein